jgi:DNA polymerase elongation subunit (family B)
MKVVNGPAPARRILDFDTECRPMHYSDWRPESQITAIAWAWVDDDPPYVDQHNKIIRPEAAVHYNVLEQDLSNEQDMLEEFLKAYDEADVVVGHYIRKHDLPLLNDHCVRAGIRPISERGGKWTIDTKQDFVQGKALGASQDNLSVMLELDNAKHHMSGADWRRANSLTPAGQAGSITRVTSDVRQNIELYQALKARGALRPMRRWPR